MQGTVAMNASSRCAATAKKRHAVNALCGIGMVRAQVYGSVCGKMKCMAGNVCEKVHSNEEVVQRVKEVQKRQWCVQCVCV